MGEDDISALAFLYSTRSFYSSRSDHAAPIPLPPSTDSTLPAVLPIDIAIETTKQTPVAEITGHVTEEPLSYDLVTVGNNIRFWGIYGRNMVSTFGDFQINPVADGPAAIAGKITAVAGFTMTDLVVTGDETGALWVWQDAKRVNYLGAHDVTYGPVTVLKRYVRCRFKGILYLGAGMGRKKDG